MHIAMDDVHEVHSDKIKTFSISHSTSYLVSMITLIQTIVISIRVALVTRAKCLYTVPQPDMNAFPSSRSFADSLLLASVLTSPPTENASLVNDQKIKSVVVVFRVSKAPGRISSLCTTGDTDS